jgi:hypothetical protein
MWRLKEVESLQMTNLKTYCNAFSGRVVANKIFLFQKRYFEYFASSSRLMHLVKEGMG